MFPSTGHFRSLHCPYHLEGNCGRIYCHFRHAKSTDECNTENNAITTLETQIAKELSLDKGAFDALINEKDENLHEVILRKKLKTVFLRHADAIDTFRLPEFSVEFSINESSLDECDENPTETSAEDVDDPPLDEGPLKQFLEEDAKRASNSEQSPIEKRHILISCLEKIDSPRRVGIIRPKKFATVDNISSLVRTENTGENTFQQQSSVKAYKVKEDDDAATDNSSDEDAAEVDDLLNQISILNPQLFNAVNTESNKESSEKNDADEIDRKGEIFATPEVPDPSNLQNFFNDALTQPYIETQTSNQQNYFDDALTQPYTGTQALLAIEEKEAQNVSENINPVKIKEEKMDEEVECVRATSPPPTDKSINSSSNNLPSATTIAEQNRLKNLFKNTINSNIDQFFDMSDACRVYGTEIFNLIEPLFTYLVQKLNPQFNFQKIQQLHSQNISLMDGLPFVSTCDHVKNCIECYNVIVCALSKGNRKTADKFTETMTTTVSSPNCDIPLRKIEAGLSNITKEFLSLGIPSANAKASSKHSSSSSGHSKSTTSKSSKDKRSSGDHGKHHSSSSSRHKSHHDSKSSEHKNKSTTKHDSKHHSSEKRSSGSGVDDKRKSSKSTSSTSEKKRRKDGDSDEKSSSEDEGGSKRVSKSKHTTSSRDSDSRKRSTSERRSSEVKKQKKDSMTVREHKRKSSPVREIMSPSILIEDSADEADDREGNATQSESSDENYSDIEQIGVNDFDDDGFAAETIDVDSDDNDSETEKMPPKSNKENEEASLFPSISSKKRVSHVSDDKTMYLKRKEVTRMNIPTPTEALYQRMQKVREAERNAAEKGVNLNDRVRIAHVSNVASLLKAKAQLKQDLFHKGGGTSSGTSISERTTAQTIPKGRGRIAHTPAEVPTPNNVPVHSNSCKPKINSYKSNNNIPLPTRQDALDRLYGIYTKKVPPEMANELALKEEKTIHEKVTIVKVYLNSVAMAIHRISKEDPAKLLDKKSDFPSELNGLSTYDLLSKHMLTREQLEVNGFPIELPSNPGCCRISTKAIHYKPLSHKRIGSRFYCLQCKELFDVCPKTGVPITPNTGCKFHALRPRKEPGRLRHELFYPCCNSSISESGCVTAEFHTPDTTDDDCLVGFVETREAPPGDTGVRQFYSLDCEMCYTTVGAELTRVTVIRHDSTVKYDSLVKPRNRILDYCTKFSGITEEKLRNVKKTLEEVRQELLRFIFKDTILIGHSLENDLKSLKLLHYNIVDTSVMYPHRDAPERKFALKFLSSNLVHYLIQESEYGHDSKEDAVACMKLVWKKIKEDANVYRPRKIIGSPTRSKS